MEYRGWSISEIPSNPVTGRWVAQQNGVSMCANTRGMLESMIDKKTVERMERTFDHSHRSGQ